MKKMALKFTDVTYSRRPCVEIITSSNKYEHCHECGTVDNPLLSIDTSMGEYTTVFLCKNCILSKFI